MNAQERAEAQAAFLTAYARVGIIRQAAEMAGVNRATVLNWRASDPEFRAAFETADADACDVIRGEIHRRGVDGWDEPVYQGGEFVGTIRRYSDVLLRLLAQSKMPEFREKLDVTSDSQAIGMAHASILTIINDPDAAALACDLLARIASASTSAPARASLPGGYAPLVGSDPGGTGDSGE